MRQAIARAAGCREQQAARLPNTTPVRGRQGPLSRGCLGKMPHLKPKPFALPHVMHMAEKHRGVKPLEQLCVDKRAAEALVADIVSQGCQQESNAALSVVTALLEK